MNPSINLRIALRSILKNKVQSLVSILGLGIGLGSIILISMLYMHENSFDKFIPENNQLYRVLHGSDSNIPFPVGEMAKNDIPAIEDFFRYHQSGEFEIKQDGKEIIPETHFACTDPSIFNCLGIDILIGKPAESINEVLISEKMAEKYFAEGDAINKTFEARLNNEFINLTVCGIFKDLPSNSTLSPQFISHTNLIGEFLGNRKKMFGEYSPENDEFKTNWELGVCATYVKISKQINPNSVSDKLQKYSERFEQEKDQKKAFSLQAVTDVYLQSSGIIDNYSRRGNANELKYFIAIALFILIIAVVNYIFLTKAKMDKRYKELGVKRAFGASASIIRMQLLFEANMVSLLSLIPAIIVVIYGTPFVNATLGRTLDNQILSDWYAIPLLSIIPLLTGSISGLFVGTKISKISPILLLNRKISVQAKRNPWSNSFLSLHFAIFIILLVGVLVFKKQINYSLNNFTGINPENVLIFELNTPELSKKFNVIVDQVEQMPGVISAAGSSFIPPFNWTLPIRLLNPESNESISLDGLIMGKGMTELLGIEIIDGAHFVEYNGDETKVIFNESAASMYNLKAGEYFSGFYIQGIAKDFTAHSMYQSINPMLIIQQHPDKMRLFAVKTRGENDVQLKADISKLFKEIAPDKMVSVITLQEQISNFYHREQDQVKLISAFSLLAIILSIMGLLGMVMNTVSRKTKEIGVRKVNGAKVSEILTMLNKDFIKWLVIAFIIAVPISYYALNTWLENFAYKTDLSWWIFALAGLIALVVVLLTVSLQSWQAATRNPIDALRDE